jgi:4-diphosphocytidyl-2C-methyl-D-erythritol kinase
MAKNIELRLEHVRLVQQGKDEEAFECLKKIWKLESGETIEEMPKPIIESKEVIKKPLPVVKKEVFEKPIVAVKKKTEEKVNKFNTFEDLRKIKGIGNKTVNDLRKIYKGDFSKLVEAARTDCHIPIRDDFEELVKTYLA